MSNRKSGVVWHYENKSGLLFLCRSKNFLRVIIFREQKDVRKLETGEDVLSLTLMF